LSDRGEGRSSKFRSVAASGFSPVNKKYNVAPSAYTSVNGPRRARVEYCSGGA
jgi:hypothetical protein